MVDSFIKLYVKDQRGRVLLGKWEGKWELPGLPWRQNQTILNEVKMAAADHGIAVSNIRLGALITRHWNDRESPLLMHYYECRYVSGDLKLPDDGTTELQWFDRQHANECIPFEFMKVIMQGIDEHQKQLLGGAHRYEKDLTSGEIVAKTITEPLYVLS